MLKKLKFDKHHKFEWFGVGVILLVVVMLFITLSAFVVKSKQDKDTMANRVIYTQKFSTSLSGISGTVEKIYRSDDNTKAFILLHWDGGSSINLSINSKNYQMFLTGANNSGSDITGEYLKHDQVTGGFYVFGASDYMGIYLVDTNGFPSQLYDLVVRCNAQLVTKSDIKEGVKDENGDVKDTFDLYDQFRIYFNPGAKDATKADFLNKNSWSATEAYEECVVRAKEDELRKKLDDDFVLLDNDLNKIKEYRERLETAGVVVPEDPVCIRGDKILTKSTVDSADAKDKVLTYVPQYVFKRGYNFDWRNGSIKQGYLATQANGQDEAAFLTAKSKVDEEYDSVSVAKTEWRMGDGTLVDDLDKSIDRNKNIVKSVELLEQTWKQYYTDKVQYQVTDLSSLLRLELDNKNVELDYSATLQGVDGNDKLLIVF